MCSGPSSERARVHLQNELGSIFRTSSGPSSERARVVLTTLAAPTVVAAVLRSAISAEIKAGLNSAVIIHGETSSRSEGLRTNEVCFGLPSAEEVRASPVARPKRRHRDNRNGRPQLHVAVGAARARRARRVSAHRRGARRDARRPQHPPTLLTAPSRKRHPRGTIAQATSSRRHRQVTPRGAIVQAVTSASDTSRHHRASDSSRRPRASDTSRRRANDC
jgi:hypothetical protein